MPLITITELEVKEAVKKYIKELGLAPETDPIVELNSSRGTISASIDLTPDLMTNLGSTKLKVQPGKVEKSLKAFDDDTDKEEPKKAKAAVKEEPLEEKEEPLTEEGGLFGDAPAEAKEETPELVEDEPANTNSDTLFA